MSLIPFVRWSWGLILAASLCGVAQPDVRADEAPTATESTALVVSDQPVEVPVAAPMETLIALLDVPADPAPPTAASPDLMKLAEQKAQAEAALQQRVAAEQQAAAANAKLTDVEQQLLKLKRELELATKTLAETEKTLAAQTEALAKANEAKAAADKVNADAAAVLLDAQTKADTAKTAAEAATKVAVDMDTAMKATSESVNSVKATMATAMASLTQTDQSLALVRTEFDGANAGLATARDGWLGKQRSVETTLTEMGQWVSFNREVAHVFHKRCLACHNARMAKGRLNLESYASLMKGGESGPAIEGGKADCNLCSQISDGSMPKDADPLAKEQIDLIAKWVQLGATLDAGVDPNAQLIKIMPKQVQPSAPEAYPMAVPVTAVALNADATLLATSGYHEVLLYNPADGAMVRRIINVAERVHDIAFTPDGQRIAIAGGTPGQMGEVKVFNVADGALLADLVTVEDAVFSVAFSTDGTRLAASGADRTIRVFDAATYAEQLVIEDHADWVMDVAWSPDGTKLASASRDKTAKVFDAKTGDAQTTFNTHADVVYTVGWLSDNAQVITGGADNRMRVWKSADAAQVREIGGFGGAVFRQQVLPDNRVFSCSADKTARVHNANDAAQIKQFAGHNDWVYALSFSPAANRLATGSYDGEVRVWNTEDGASLKNWYAAPGYAPTAAK